MQRNHKTQRLLPRLFHHYYTNSKRNQRSSILVESSLTLLSEQSIKEPRTCTKGMAFTTCSRYGDKADNGCCQTVKPDRSHNSEGQFWRILNHNPWDILQVVLFLTPVRSPLCFLVVAQPHQPHLSFPHHQQQQPSPPCLLSPCNFVLALT